MKNEKLRWEDILVELVVWESRDKDSGRTTMEVDFLVAKSCLQCKHNIVPVEVKRAREYATSSLEKYTAKFSDYSRWPVFCMTRIWKRKMDLSISRSTWRVSLADDGDGAVFRQDHARRLGDEPPQPRNSCARSCG